MLGLSTAGSMVVPRMPFQDRSSRKTLCLLLVQHLCASKAWSEMIDELLIRRQDTSRTDDIDAPPT